MPRWRATARFAKVAKKGGAKDGHYVDELLSYTVGATRYFTHANSLYSIAAVTDGTGAVVERYAYDAYGTRTVTNAAGTVELATSSVSQSRGFTGYILDQETGWYHARWRPYSPTLGRFPSRDPWGYIDGLSLYRAYFVPNALDPYGRDERIETPCGTLVAQSRELHPQQALSKGLRSTDPISITFEPNGQCKCTCEQIEYRLSFEKDFGPVPLPQGAPPYLRKDAPCMADANGNLLGCQTTLDLITDNNKPVKGMVEAWCQDEKQGSFRFEIRVGGGNIGVMNPQSGVAGSMQDTNPWINGQPGDAPYVPPAPPEPGTPPVTDIPPPPGMTQEDLDRLFQERMRQMRGGR